MYLRMINTTPFLANVECEVPFFFVLLTTLLVVTQLELHAS